MKKTRVFFGVLLVLLTTNIWAQVRFYAQAPKQIPVNQNFQVSYVIENSQGSNFRRPSFEGFELLSGPSQSTSVQIINGSMTQSLTLGFVLRPTKEGVFKIGKATVTVSGANLESNELTIEVGKAVAQQQQQQRRSNNPFFWDPFSDEDPFEDFFRSQRQPEVSQQDIEKQIRENVFTRMEVSRSELYEGEALTATLKLYFRLGVANLSLSKAPSFSGFWNQEIELPKDQRPHEETYNGQRYNVYEIQKFNLYPQKSGKLSISETEVQTIVQAQVGRGFFGSVQNFKHDCKTAPVTINVKGIPEQGKPESYNGAIGNFKYTASISATNAKTDDAITYSLKVSGEGNLKLIEAPTLQLPESFEVFEPKVKENISNTSGGMSGFKQFDYLIIPRQPGEYKIPAQTFSHFNLSQKKYIEETTPEYTLTITGEPSKVAQSSNTTSTASSSVKMLGKDILYIKTKPELVTSSNNNPWLFASLYLLPLLLTAGLWVYKKRNDHLESDIAGMKKRKATRMAQKRLKMAENHLKKRESVPFYNEVSKSIWGYLGDKLSMDMADLNKENVSDKLLNKGVKPETIQSLLQLIGNCDMALYGISGSAEGMQNNYQEAVNLITQLEEEIK